MFRRVKQIPSPCSPYRFQEVHNDRRVIDDRRVTPPDTCGTEDEPTCDTARPWNHLRFENRLSRKLANKYMLDYLFSFKICAYKQSWQR